MQVHGPPAPSAEQVERVHHHQDTELIQSAISTSSTRLDCHLNNCPGPTKLFDWQEVHSARRLLEGDLDFILTGRLRIYLNQQEMLMILQRWLLLSFPRSMRPWTRAHCEALLPIWRSANHTWRAPGRGFYPPPSWGDSRLCHAWHFPLASSLTFSQSKAFPRCLEFWGIPMVGTLKNPFLAFSESTKPTGESDGKKGRTNPYPVPGFAPVHYSHYLIPYSLWPCEVVWMNKWSSIHDVSPRMLLVHY